jgi:hypothetical protein
MIAIKKTMISILMSMTLSTERFGES